ncbi:MAG: hypothetical protein QNJ98_13145 [Planctomycetota bacterium]|nr:hypothetical protein [Planctomycetota bacterium]
MARVLPLLLLALLTVDVRAVQAEEGSLKSRWAAVRSETVERLHALAKWSGKAKLFRARAEVYEGILRFDPDDKTARKRLKYVKGKDGAWVRKANYKPPKNLSKAKPEFLTKRAELGAWFAEEVAPLVEEAEAEGDLRVRAAIVAGAIGVDPERATFRTWNREVKDGKIGWVLAETESARTRRAGIQETAAKAVKAVEAPEAGAGDKDDKVGGVEWTSILEGKRVRVLGIVEGEETEQILRNLEACWPVFRYALDRTAPTYRPRGRYVRAGWTAYVFDDVDAANAFYAAQPGVTERDKEFTKRLVGTWIPKRTAALVKSPIPATRIEATSKQLLGAINNHVLGLGRKRAWAAEGLTLYLNYQIVGTRAIYSVNDVETEYAEGGKPIPEYTKRMLEPGVSWLELGRLLIDSPDKPDIHLMSGKDFNTLTRAEMLYGYCVAAYVIEGWPKKAAEFFQTVSGDFGTDMDRVCLETFGMDAKAFEQRLRRWLEETKDL